MKFKAALLLLVLLFTACQGDPPSMQERGPTRSVVTGNERTLYYFNEAETWDLFTVEGDLAYFRLDSGALEGYVAADRGYLMTTNNTPHYNVIVNLTLRQSGGTWGNGFGVVCRADDQGNGYYFLLSSTGEFSISVATPVRAELFQLIPWQHHTIIKTGYQENEIRAVCADDYLAMFINDVFVAETTDDEFTTGSLGLVVGAVGEAARVRFEELLLRDALMR